MAGIRDFFKAAGLLTEKEYSPVDQGFTHHIITFKTNVMCIDKKVMKLDQVIGQVEAVMSQENSMPIFFTD